jgi:hypothetical protein
MFIIFAIQLVDFNQLWHWVISTTAPRMATQDAFYAQPSAFENAMFHYRLHHVLATSGNKAAARWSKRRDT